MIEAVSVAVHAANRTPITLGDTAVVIGTGMIGLLVVQAIRLAGCSRVIAVDMNEHRLNIARSLGVDTTINAVEEDGSATIKIYRNPLVNWIWAGAIVYCGPLFNSMRALI